MFAICRVEMGLNVAQDWRMGVAAIEQQLAEDWGVQNGMQEGKGELLHGNVHLETQGALFRYVSEWSPKDKAKTKGGYLKVIYLFSEATNKFTLFKI